MLEEEFDKQIVGILIYILSVSKLHKYNRVNIDTSSMRIQDVLWAVKEADKKVVLSHTLNEGMRFSNEKNSRHNYNSTEERFLRIIYLRNRCFNIFKIYEAMNRAA